MAHSDQVMGEILNQRQQTLFALGIDPLRVFVHLHPGWITGTRGGPIITLP